MSHLRIEGVAGDNQTSGSKKEVGIRRIGDGNLDKE